MQKSNRVPIDKFAQSMNVLFDTLWYWRHLFRGKPDPFSSETMTEPRFDRERSSTEHRLNTVVQDGFVPDFDFSDIIPIDDNFF